MLKEVKNIYSNMGDDISKRIYLCRFNYSISQDEGYIEEMLDISIRRSREWKEFLTHMRELNGRDTVLFGNGIWGHTLISEMRDFPVKCIIDNSPAMSQTTCVPVVNAKDFLADYSGEKIIISSYKNREAMVAQCKAFGVSDSNIMDASIIIYGLTEGRIYFDEDVPMNVGDGIFIDGGCFDGSDTKRFVGEYEGNAICFEPDAENIERIEKRLKDIDRKRYRVVQKGLWSSTGKVAFACDGTCSSHIAIEACGCEAIETGTIDEEAGEDSVSMIKMDIEGAELEALKGARKVIEKNHPILAISVYHKPEDIIEIPDYILGLYDGYRFYLRHYSFSWYDTVLYAVPEEKDRR